MLETIATVIAIVVSVGGSAIAIARSITGAIAKLNHRFDRLEDEQVKDLHNQEISRRAIESRFQQIEYQIETMLQYGIHANKELIEHKMRRVERAIASLAGGLERISEGRYKPRGPDYWPTDEPPVSTYESASIYSEQDN
jgi:hypothetical protein